MDFYQSIKAGRKFERLDNPDSYNKGIRDSWMPFWVKNAGENYAPIKELCKQEPCDVSALGNNAEAPVLIIGSGPSLNDWEPYFKDWKGEIYVSSSHLAYFEALGVTPTYCFIIDADPNMSYLVAEAETKDITLITHPNMDPEVLKAWDGPVRFFRMNDPGDDWFGSYMPMMYSEFGEVELEAGALERDWGGGSGEFKGKKKSWVGVQCYVLNSGNVTNTMVALSQMLGAGRNLFLCGVDLGFPELAHLVKEKAGINAWNERCRGIVLASQSGKEFDESKYEEWEEMWAGWRYRFNGYKRTEDGFEPNPDTGIPKTRLLKEGHNGIKTDQVSCFYKYSTLILYGMDAPNLYSCSRGILDEVSYIAPTDVVACQGDVAESYKVLPAEKYRVAQKYLAYRGIYIMKGQGWSRKKAVTKHEFLQSKKRIVRYTLFTTRLRQKFKKLTPEVRKQIIHPLMRAPAVKFRLRWFEWVFTPEVKTTTLLGYVGITNKYHVKGLARVKLMIKFYLGKAVRLW